MDGLYFATAAHGEGGGGSGDCGEEVLEEWWEFVMVIVMDMLVIMMEKD